MKKTAAFTLLAVGLAACRGDDILQPRAVNDVSRSFGAGIQSVCPAPPAGLVSWWRGDGNATDSKGGNPGTLVNGTTFTTGRVGPGFLFDGVDDDLLIGTKANLNVGLGAGLTIQAWIHPEGIGSTSFSSGPLVEYSLGVHLWQLDQTGGPNGLYANLVEANGNYHVLNAPASVTLHGWNHVAVTYVKSTGIATLYVNGAVVTSLNIGSLTLKTDTDLHIGSRPPSGWPSAGTYNGWIDDVQIYSRGLPQAAIQASYTAGVSGACNLVANAGSAVTGVEGTEVVFNGNASTGQNSATFDWDFGDGSIHGTVVSPHHTYKDNGVYTVTLTMHDGTLSSAATTSATIGNVLPVPTLTLQTTGPIHVGQQFVLRAGFSDAGVLDGPWAYKFYRNANVLQQGTKPAQPPPGVTQAVQLTSATAGTFTYKLEMTDKDGGLGTVSLAVQILP